MAFSSSGPGGDSDALRRRGFGAPAARRTSLAGSNGGSSSSNVKSTDLLSQGMYRSDSATAAAVYDNKLRVGVAMANRPPNPSAREKLPSFRDGPLAFARQPRYEQSNEVAGYWREGSSRDGRRVPLPFLGDKVPATTASTGRATADMASGHHHWTAARRENVTTAKKLTPVNHLHRNAADARDGPFTSLLKPREKTSLSSLSATDSGQTYMLRHMPPTLPVKDKLGVRPQVRDGQRTDRLASNGKDKQKSSKADKLMADSSLARTPGPAGRHDPGANQSYDQRLQGSSGAVNHDPGHGRSEAQDPRHTEKGGRRASQDLQMPAPAFESSGKVETPSGQTQPLVRLKSSLKPRSHAQVKADDNGAARQRRPSVRFNEEVLSKTASDIDVLRAEEHSGREPRPYAATPRYQSFNEHNAETLKDGSPFATAQGPKNGTNGPEQQLHNAGNRNLGSYSNSPSSQLCESINGFPSPSQIGCNSDSSSLYSNPTPQPTNEFNLPPSYEKAPAQPIAEDKRETVISKSSRQPPGHLAPIDIDDLTNRLTELQPGMNQPSRLVPKKTDKSAPQSKAFPSLSGVQQHQQQSSPNGMAPFCQTGLKNLGNTCYMNCVLQCLSHTRPLRRLALSGELDSSSPTATTATTSKSPKKKLASELASLIKKMWSPQLPSLRSFAPRQFRQQVVSYHRDFAGSDQHDASELLQCVLRNVHRETHSAKDKRSAAKDLRASEDESLDFTERSQYWLSSMRSTENSPITDLFAGTMTSVLSCCVCRKVKTKFELFYELDLPIPKQPSSAPHKPRPVRSNYYSTTFQNLGMSNDEAERRARSNGSSPVTDVTLADCIHLYQTEERMEGGNQVYCEECHGKQDMVKKYIFYHLPQILVISLKRFEMFGSRAQKLMTTVNFDCVLPVDAFKLPRGLDSGTKYRLFGVVNHLGQADGGHYTAMCSNLDNSRDPKWRQYNDEMVGQPMTQKSGQCPPCNSSTYMLFYERMPAGN